MSAEVVKLGFESIFGKGTQGHPILGSVCEEPCFEAPDPCDTCFEGPDDVKATAAKQEAKI